MANVTNSDVKKKVALPMIDAEASMQAELEAFEKLMRHARASFGDRATLFYPWRDDHVKTRAAELRAIFR